MKTQCLLSCLLGTMLVVGCSGGPTSPEDPSSLDPASGNLVLASEKSSLASPDASTQSRKEWFKALRHVAVPKDGCFKASYPSTTWVEIPCTTPPVPDVSPPSDAPSPQDIGSGNDYAACANSTCGGTGSSLIAEGAGSFMNVSDVTSEMEFVPNNYSLQLNSNNFTSSQITKLCNGNQACASAQGWEQFVYTNTQADSAPGFGAQATAFIQYWLLNWNTTCPAGWSPRTGTQAKCMLNGPVVSPTVPGSQPITNLANLSLTGSAGSSDQLWFYDGDGTGYTTAAQGSILGLNTGWNWAEFGIYGNGNGSEACFNSGASFTTNVDIVTTAPTTPYCALINYHPGQGGQTAETNNLQPITCTPGVLEPGIGYIQITDIYPQTCKPGLGTYPPVAMEANAAGGYNLYTESYSSYGSVNQGLGMSKGTVPSLAVVPSNQQELEIAFQANTGDLWVEETDVTGHFVEAGDRGAGSAMCPFSSPSITVQSGGSLVIAYQGMNHDLWLEKNGAGSGSDQSLGMAPETSPSVGVLPNGQIVTAFQANTGYLYVQQNGLAYNLGAAMNTQMDSGTSPSLAVDPSGGYAIVFQSSTNYLYKVLVGSSPSNFDYENVGFGMQWGTSPSVTYNGTTLHWAFQANTHNLWVDSTDQTLPMNQFASPTILPLPGAGLGGFEVAYQASNNDLWLDLSNASPKGYDMYLGMYYVGD